METYIIVVVSIFILDIIGKFNKIIKEDFTRNPEFMLWAIIIGLIMIVWGTYLL